MVDILQILPFDNLYDNSVIGLYSWAKRRLRLAGSAGSMPDPNIGWDTRSCIYGAHVCGIAVYPIVPLPGILFPNVDILSAFVYLHQFPACTSPTNIDRIIDHFYPVYTVEFEE